MQKLIRFIFPLIALCSCSQTKAKRNDYSTEKQDKICASFCKSREIDEQDYKYYSLVCNLLTRADCLSIDTIKYSREGVDSATIVNNCQLNGEYICTFPDASYYLNVCALDTMCSYSLEDAYSQSIINDSDIADLIRACDAAGYRCTEETD